MAQGSKYCKQMSCFGGFVNTHLKINVYIDLAYHCISIPSYKYDFASENVYTRSIFIKPMTKNCTCIYTIQGKNVGQ